MRKIPTAGLVVPVLVLALGAWGCSDGGGGTGTAGTGGGAAGRGGTGGGAAGTGGGAAGTGGSATGGSTAGTGGGAAGTGGGAAGRGGTGGGTAGTGGATGGSTAGAGGSAAGTGGATGGSTAGSGGATAGTGGGTAGTGGGTGGTAVIPPNPTLGGTATRPQLAAGTDHTILKYFEKGGPVSALVTDNWDPTAGVGDVSTFTATYTVAATGGTHTTVQAALNAAVTAGGTTRVYIKVEPGTYRETVCLKASPTPPPITLYSTNADASMTTIVNNGYAGKAYTDPPPTDPPWNPCAATNPPAIATPPNTYGTSGSAAVAFYARDFQAKNLTFANDYAEVGTSSIQAVALMTQNDKQIYENVRVLGNQDSLYVKTGNVDTVQRVYFKNCYVEGDTDFIFGRATFVLDNCEIKYLGARRGATSGGYVVSPSTDVRNAYGLLIINSMFTSDSVPNAGTVFLGRAWDEGQMTATYPMPTAAGGFPNGQVVIRGSTLGAHIAAAAPWASASTTSRAYSSVAAGAIPANRLWEFQNTGAGAATP